MKKCAFLLLLLLVLFSQHPWAQNAKADSLIALIKKDKNDTNKVSHLNQLGIILVNENPDTVIILAKEALKIITPISTTEFLPSNAKTEERGISLLRARALRLLGAGYYFKDNYWDALENFHKSLQTYIALNDTNMIASSYDNIASTYIQVDNYSKALSYAQLSLKMAEKTGDKEDRINSIKTIGQIYSLQNHYPKALEQYLKALKIAEELDDKRYEASLLLSIGSIHKQNDEDLNALDYYLKALKLAEPLDNRRLLNNCFDNISRIYCKLKEYSKAIEYNSKALEIAKKTGDQISIASCFVNSGVIYQEQKNFVKAEEYYLKSLKLVEEIGDKSRISTIENNLGGLYVLTGKFKEAEKYISKSINTAIELGDNLSLARREYNLAALYDSLGRYKEAYVHYKKASEINDTIFIREKQASLVRKEMNYEFEKKEAATQALHDKEIAVAEEEKEKQRLLIYSIASGLLLTFAFAAYIFYSLRTTRKQKLIIEQQKEKIIDSIDYAQSIQQSILPDENVIKKHLPESFILYLPKDIVSGDFYWFSQNTQKKKLIIAAVDCTGHGVPGAFMSMIGSMLLNQIINESNVTTPSEILDLLNNGVKNALNSKNGKTSADGMDIALCTIDYENKEIQYAGAHNPLYIISDNTIEIINADSDEIGGRILRKKKNENKTFTNHRIPFKDNMSIYLFSDGFADQFGGADMKRYGKQRFQELLLNNQRLSMEQQKEALFIAHEQWKGKAQQIDDILVIGIKIKSEVPGNL